MKNIFKFAVALTAVVVLLGTVSFASKGEQPKPLDLINYYFPKTGWIFVSIPQYLTVANPQLSIRGVFCNSSQIGVPQDADCTKVLYYNSTEKSWKEWDSSKDDSLNSLLNVDNGYGYWVYVTRTGFTNQYEGNYADPITFENSWSTMVLGWNSMMGWTGASTSTKLISDAVSDIKTTWGKDIKRVWKYSKNSADLITPYWPENPSAEFRKYYINNVDENRTTAYWDCVEDASTVDVCKYIEPELMPWQNQRPVLEPASPTVIPTIGEGGVTPFTFRIKYTDSDNDPASPAYVVIDGVPHTMTTADTTYTDGSIYEYTTLLTFGEHKYYFNFSDGVNHVFYDGTNTTKYPKTVSYDAAATLNMTVGDTIPPTDIAGLSNNTNSHWVGLAWDASTDNGSGIGKYLLYMNGMNFANTTSINFNVTGLAEWTNYTFAVGAVDNANNYGGNSTLTTKTADLTAPAQVAGVSSPAQTGSSIYLTWSPSSDSGSGLANYLVFRGGVNVANTTDTKYNDTGLGEYVQYAYSIKAVDNAGNINTGSATLAKRTLDITVPSKVTGLNAAGGDAKVELSWTAATDAGSGVAYHKVFRNGIKVTETGATGWTDTNVIEDATYSYTIAAVDNSGNEGQQSAASAATVLNLKTILIGDGFINKATELYRNGTLKWQKTGITASSVWRLSNGNTLVADHSGPVVYELNPAGGVVWSYGTAGKFGYGNNELFYAQGAMRLENGNTLITDNSRVIEVKPDKTIAWQYSVSYTGGLKAVKLTNGHYLVAEYYNHRVVELDSGKNIVWKYGAQYPTSAFRLANGNTLIASKEAGVIEVTSTGAVVWSSDAAFGPSYAVRLKNGNTLIADSSSNRQVLEVNKTGAVIRQWYSQGPLFVAPANMSEMDANLAVSMAGGGIELPVIPPIAEIQSIGSQITGSATGKLKQVGPAQQLRLPTQSRPTVLAQPKAAVPTQSKVAVPKATVKVSAGIRPGLANTFRIK